MTHNSQPSQWIHRILDGKGKKKIVKRQEYFKQMLKENQGKKTNKLVQYDKLPCFESFIIIVK